MLTRIFIFLLLLFVFSVKDGAAQTYPFINFTTKNGLPSNMIYSIFCDGKGYLWFGTDKGLAIYNGKDFKSFSSSNGLPDNEIFGFKEDRQGKIWLITFNGELCFYKDGIFHTKANTPWLNLPFNVHISDIRNESNDSITIHFTGFKHIVNIYKDILAVYDLSKLATQTKLIGESFVTIQKISSNHYEAHTIDKTMQIDTLGNLLQEPRIYNKLYWAVNTNTQPVFVTLEGVYEKKEQFLFPLKDVSLFERIILLKSKSDYWIGRGSGLSINDSKLILKDRFVTALAIDKEDGYWAGTRENGVFCFHKDIEKIKEWQSSYTGKAKQGKVINGSLNFLTDAGQIYQVKTDTLEAIFSKAGIPMIKSGIKANNFMLSTNLDYLVLSNGNGTVLKNTRNNTYACSDISQALKALNLHSLKHILQHNDFLYFFEISKVKRINLNSLLNGQIEHYKELIDEPMDERIYALAENKEDSTVWISRANGLFKLSDTLVLHQKQFKQMHFREMHFYNNYLLGFTDKSQFLICNRYNTSPVVDTVKSENCIYANIYPIDDYRAIISTNNYYRVLTLHPPAENGKPNYSIKSIESPFIPLEAEYITADKEFCYFFKEGTITRVATALLFEQTRTPVPLFSSISAGKKPVRLAKEITISYNESQSINIIFDNISFIGKDITSQYSLSENGKDDWRDITGNEINLNTPGYGTFIIKVRSKTLSSGYSKPATLTLHIQKPFWATWWFISLAAVAFILLVWGIVLLITWRRLRKRQKEHEADMKYQQSEYKALNALMNPHFIFNSLNNIQGLINKDEKRTANQYLVIFSDLVRQNMHNISKGFISLQEELTLIENYLTLEKLRFKELVNYRINVEEDIDIDDIMIPPLMIQPLVENAVKHGLLPKQSSSSMVVIDVYEKGDILYVVIEDNGIGLTASLKSQNRLHDSFGLSNLQKRTEHLKKIQQHEISIEVAEIKDVNGLVTGTRAIVTIQLN